MRLRSLILKFGIGGAGVLMVNAATASTVWNPAANGIVPPAVGYFGTADNWTAGLPVDDSEKKAVFNVEDAAECVVTNTHTGARIIQGDNGADDAGTLRIASGGNLTALGDWSAVGFNRKATCVVEEGGTYSFENHAWIGHVPGGEGTLEVHGTFNVSGMFGLGFSGGEGHATVYDTGRLNLANWNETDSIKGDSSLDLWEGAIMTLSGDRGSSISNNVAAGKLLGNRLTNNVIIAVNEVEPGVTNTVVSVNPSIPNLAGLTPTEAEDVLSVFGYTLGTTSEGSAPGGVTGFVIGSVPAAGSPTNGYPAGSAINIVIQEAGTVPDLVGLSYAQATNTIIDAGYIIGVETETYTYEATPDLVTAQSPAGGSDLTPGSAIDIDFNERLGPETKNVAGSSGDWSNVAIWDQGVVPTRETQNYEVQIRGGNTVTLTNFVATRRLHQGHNGTGSDAVLNITNGAHLVSGMFDNYAAVGWNARAVLNVYEGGVYESKAALRVAWQADASNSVINIDGGSVIAAGWLSLGSDGASSSTITVSNGGSLFCDYINTGRKNGVIIMNEGTFTTSGTGLGNINDALNDGYLVVAEGYESSLDVINGNAVLTVYLPGYAAWASLWGEDIGDEMTDHDSDGAANLKEYALNGDPTDDQDAGEEPVFTKTETGFIYTHLLRADDMNLVYTVETTDNLAVGSWTPAGSTIGGTNLTGEAYNVLTNIISTVDDASFIRLKIENP